MNDRNDLADRFADIIKEHTDAAQADCLVAAWQIINETDLKVETKNFPVGSHALGSAFALDNPFETPEEYRARTQPKAWRTRTRIVSPWTMPE